jgi:hypothetical protein
MQKKTALGGAFVGLVFRSGAPEFAIHELEQARKPIGLGENRRENDPACADFYAKSIDYIFLRLEPPGL